MSEAQRSTPEPDNIHPLVSEVEVDAVQEPQPRKLLVPPPQPQKTVIPRISTTMSETIDICKMAIDGGEKVTRRLYWHDINSPEILPEIEDIQNVANPRDVAAISVTVTYPDSTELTLRLSFSDRTSYISVYGVGEARTRMRALLHRHQTLRKGPSWLLHINSWLFSQMHIVMILPIISFIAWIALTVVQVLTREPRDWTAADPSVVFTCAGVAAALAGIGFLLHGGIRGRFYLRIDTTDRRPNWEVRWGALGALFGLAGVIVAILGTK